jgi:hypothetical protein
MNKFYYYDVLITYMHMFYFNPSLNCITIYEQVYEYLGKMIRNENCVYKCNRTQSITWDLPSRYRGDFDEILMDYKKKKNWCE